MSQVLLLHAGGNDRIRKKEKKRIETKYIWETNDFIPLFPLVGINYFQPIIQMPKIMVYIFTRYEQINQFTIGYMINPSLHINKMFREQV